MEATRAHGKRRLLPLRLQSTEGREKKQGTQRDLKVRIDKKEPFNPVNIEVVDDAPLLEQQSDGTVETQNNDKCKGKRNTREITRHVGKTHHRVTQSPGNLLETGCSKRSNQESHKGTAETQPQRIGKGLRIKGIANKFGVVCKSPLDIFLNPERIDEHPYHGNDLESKKDDGKRHKQKRASDVRPSI